MAEPTAGHISPIGDILADARAGRPFILTDPADPASGGEIIVSAQFATADVVNFMATHARGLVCLALDSESASRLGLQLMARDAADRPRAFAVSIEAREGVTTGISAYDRARTIAVAVDQNSQPADLVTPGHVFPIIVREGGALMRPGVPEAAVDIARLAGHVPAAVTCRILGGEGEIGSPAELRGLAERHDLRIGSVADLIAHRRLTEKLVERTASAPFESRYCGDVTVHVYRNLVDGGEHLALVRGCVSEEAITLVRVHQVDLTTDVLGWSAGRQDYVRNALEEMAAYRGPSVAVFIQDPSPTSLADRIAGGRKDYMKTHAHRDYGVGAQILIDVGVRKMVVLSSSRMKLAALEGFGLHIVERRPVPGVRLRST